MKFRRCVFKNGARGFWILPCIGFDWVTGHINFWAAWLYWMVKIEFKKDAD